MADSTSTPKRAARARTGSKRRQKGNPPKKPRRPSKIHTAKASVERFLEREAGGVDAYLDELDDRSPLRRTSPEPAAD